MAIPDYETLMLPLLRIGEAEKGNEVSLLDAIAKLAAEYKLTDEERKEDEERQQAEEAIEFVKNWRTKPKHDKTIGEFMGNDGYLSSQKIREKVDTFDSPNWSSKRLKKCEWIVTFTYLSSYDQKKITSQWKINLCSSSLKQIRDDLDWFDLQ